MGVEIDLVVLPRASRSRVVGIHDGRLKISLAAPPVDGAANEALIRLVARTLDIPPSRVHVRRGETSRRKTLSVEGITQADALQALRGDEQ